MELTSESVRVNICGNDYSINADVDTETTKKVAQYVDQKMVTVKKYGAVKDNLKVAVLSALNIAGEMHEYKEKCERTQQIIQKIQNEALLLSKKIEESINEM